MALMGRAFSQAQKFGVEIAIPDEAVKLECGNDPCHLLLATGERVQARSVVIATGARYRRLEVDRLDEFEGIVGPLLGIAAGGRPCRRPGGRAGRRRQFSAGQAMVFLASRAQACDAWSPGGRSSETMSQYLIERIEGLPNVEVVIGCEISRARKERTERSRASPFASARRAREPKRRAPLPLLLHRRGAEHRLAAKLRPQARRARVRDDGTGGDDRLPLETSRRGIFAVGDVRSGSVKRVAASVGDGAQVVAAIHQYLAAQAEPPVLIEQQIQVTAAE